MALWCVGTVLRSPCQPQTTTFSWVTLSENKCNEQRLWSMCFPKCPQWMVHELRYAWEGDGGGMSGVIIPSEYALTEDYTGDWCGSGSRVNQNHVFLG